MIGKSINTSSNKHVPQHRICCHGGLRANLQARHFFLAFVTIENNETVVGVFIIPSKLLFPFLEPLIPVGVYQKASRKIETYRNRRIFMQHVKLFQI